MACWMSDWLAVMSDCASAAMLKAPAEAGSLAPMLVRCDLVDFVDVDFEHDLGAAVDHLGEGGVDQVDGVFVAADDDAVAGGGTATCLRSKMFFAMLLSSLSCSTG